MLDLKQIKGAYIRLLFYIEFKNSYNYIIINQNDMKSNYYLRAYNIEEAKEKKNLKVGKLDSFVDLTVETEDGVILSKHNGKFIIKCKDYKVGNLFAHKNWEKAISINEYSFTDSVHVLIAVAPDYMLEYKTL